jgi:hypothetical protein
MRSRGRKNKDVLINPANIDLIPARCGALVKALEIEQ